MQLKRVPAVLPALLPSLLVFLTSCGFSDGFSDSSANTSQNQQAVITTVPAASQDSGPIETASPENTTDSDVATDVTMEVASDVTTEANDTQFRLSANGILGFDDLTEASGLVASRNQSNLLWVIADSGNSPDLFAIDDAGSELGRVTLAASNRDWEELATFTLNGVHFLLIADTGDNLKQYSSYPLHIIREPQSSAGGPLQPVLTLNLTYSDGAHDVEALAVSESDGNLYLVTKDETPAVYAAPLLTTLTSLIGSNPEQSVNIPITAARVGELHPPRQSAADSFLGLLAGVNLGDVTAMDIDDARGRIWLLTYTGIYLVQISGNETPGQALTSRSRLIARHSLGQAESLAYSNLQDAVFITSEGRAATVLKLSAQ